MLIRAEEARDAIPEALRAAGHRISIVPAYRNITPADTLPALARIFAAPESCPDIITFTSSSTARNLFALLENAGIALPHGIVLASIGPITSATLRELGCEPTLEAAEATIDSLVAAIALYLEGVRLADD
jgi:uroporphyrinogen-III synthase